MKIETLQKLANRSIVDYAFIISALKDYAKPRDKITSWLKSNKLIRIKKGLYIFDESIAFAPFSKEVLANLIYGPSAISLQYALFYYGLIPERVEQITSITTGRYKYFATPVGAFSYHYLKPELYSVGIAWVDTQNSFLIASPEKALCDQIFLIDKKIIYNDFNSLEKYLFEDLRIDESLLFKFNLKLMTEIVNRYQDDRLKLLYNYIKSRK